MDEDLYEALLAERFATPPPRLAPRDIEPGYDPHFLDPDTPEGQALRLALEATYEERLLRKRRRSATVDE